MQPREQDKEHQEPAKGLTVSEALLLKMSREALAAYGRDARQDEVFSALEGAVRAQVSRRSRGPAERHVLWPYRHLICLYMMDIPARGRAQAIIAALKANPATKPAADRLTSIDVGRWLVKMMPVVQAEIQKRQLDLAPARAEVATRQEEREQNAPTPVHSLSDIRSSQPIPQPAMPAAREEPPPPAKQEGELDYTGLSPSEVQAVNAAHTIGARADALAKIRSGHTLRAQIDANTAAKAERDANAKSAAKSRSLEDFIGMKFDDMTIHDRREALERLAERRMVSATIYEDYRELNGHEDHYVAKLRLLLKEASRKI